MNDTLKVAGRIGAELAAAKADLQREMERHRKTWRQLEKVKGLLREIIGALRSDRDLGLWQCRMNEADRWEREAAALSQQAEPTDTFTAVDMATAAAQGFRDGQAAVEPAPAQDERESVDTVPRWKFHALVEQCKKQDQLISDLYARLNSVRLYDEKEVWFWQGDGCDHLESLACPVVIEADELRRLVNADPIAQAEQQPSEESLVQNAKALLALDERGALAPHGIGGLAREVIEKLIAHVERTTPPA